MGDAYMITLHSVATYPSASTVESWSFTSAMMAASMPPPSSTQPASSRTQAHQFPPTAYVRKMPK